MIGRTVGHFRLVGHLGRGASGTVYRAIDEVLDREVALKILNPGQVDPDAVARFRAEATTLGRLTHPSIATLYELFEADGHLVMAMECVHGDTLDQLSERLGPLPPGRAAYLTDRILAAVEHAHRAGVLHCDLKPANVVVSDGDVKIMDFGIARMLGCERSSEEGLLGTPAYMAPEQVLGEPLDPRTDVYAVGVIFFKLLTGTLPFEADAPAAVLQRQIMDAPPLLRSRRTDVPAWCEPIVRRALAKRPADRFQSADEFRQALARETVLAPPPTHRYVAAGGVRPLNEALVLVAAAAGIGLLVFGATRDRMPSAPPAPSLPAVEAIEPAPPVPDTAIPLAPTTAPAATPDAEIPVPPRVEKPVKPSFRQLEFDTKALVADGRKARERNARLVLADRALTVMDDDAGRLLYSVPYDSVTSINYSHSRDPLWASPDGPVPVVRTSGGVLRTFGLFVERAWVSLATTTSARFVVLRVGDGEVTHLLDALQERTRRSVQRVQPKRDTATGPDL